MNVQSFSQDTLSSSISTRQQPLADQSSATTYKNLRTDNLPCQVNKDRLCFIAGVHVAAYTGTLLLLSQAWYNDFPKTSFHTFNDSREWLQVDKAGHAWTAYNIAHYSQLMWTWTGMPYQRSAWLGGISSLGYQTILEFLDGHSAGWGWSWSDMSANVFGSALFTSQQLIWKEQKTQFKFSSFPVRYNAVLEQRADVLYGRGFFTSLLKDYNGQTYWLSMNISGFLPHTGLPRFLNIAVGYGAKGMFGGFENRAYDKNGILTFDGSGIRRQRQWYLSPDIDWTKIKTRKNGVRTALLLLNMIKVPAPGIELSGRKIKARWLLF